MSQTQRTKTEPTEQRKPPMPALMVRLINPLVKLLLSSPLHSGMSKRLMVLSFHGRKTGKRYATPVGYVQEGDTVFVFTHSSWRKNFQQPAPVQMRIRGTDVRGTARLVTDPARIRQIVQALTAANGEEMSRRMGFWVDDLGSATPDQVRQGTAGTYFIEIQRFGGK